MERPAAAQADASCSLPLELPAKTQQQRQQHGATCWQRWEALGAPQYARAPMVLQSELPFRMLVRRWGCQLCYSPMILASQYLTATPERRHQLFSTAPEDRQLVVQLGGNDAAAMLQAAQLLQGDCDVIDVNLGCPQATARRDGFGAYLMEDPALIHSMVSGLVKGLNIPVSCKIRCFADVADTVKYALMLQDAGAKFL